MPDNNGNETSQLAEALEQAAGSDRIVDSVEELETALNSMADEELTDIREALMSYLSHQECSEGNPIAGMTSGAGRLASIIQDADEQNENVQVLLTENEMVAAAMARFPDLRAGRGR